MKKIILFFLFFITLKINSQCPNGDVEQGNFGNFTRMQGSFGTPLNVMQFNPTPVQTGSPSWFRQEVVNSPLGPHTVADNVNSQITLSDEGFYCIRINNKGANYQKDGVYYSFTVTNANKYFKFKYAMVLQDPGHSQSDQPFVTFFMNVLYPCGGANIPHVPAPPFFGFGCGGFLGQKIQDWNLFNQTVTSKVADSSNPFFKQGSDATVYKNWQCVQYDLSAYIGQTVSLCILAAGCNQGGHYGYVYLDGLCKPNIATSNFNLSSTTFCSNSTIIMDGTSSIGGDRYFIEIAECDALGNLIPGGGIQNWWTLGATPPNNINIKNEYTSHGGVWKCNTFYKIKLAVMSECAPWSEKSLIIKYTCPEVTPPINQIACCPPPRLPQVPCFNLIAQNANPAYTYNWSSTSPAGTNFSGPIVNNYCTAVSNIFNLTVTDPSGCQATIPTTILIQGNLNASINVPNINQSCGGGCNNPPVTVNYNVTKCREAQSEIFNTAIQNTAYNYWVNYPFFNWQAGNQSSFSPPTSGNYAAVVANGCQTRILPFSTVVKNLYTPSLIAPNAFAPSSSITANQIFRIQDYNINALPIGQGPSYGSAIDFELKIYDRFGGNFRTIHKSDIGLSPNDCLKNGDIQWDGKDSGGNLVPNDVYNYCLSLKLCNGNWYSWSVNNTQNPLGCLKNCTYFDWHWPFIHTYCCVSCGYAYHVTRL